MSNNNELSKIKKYLNIIGLPYDSNFSIDDIQTLYRAKAKILHPDARKVDNAHEKFIELKNAKDYLEQNYENVLETIKANMYYFKDHIIENDFGSQYTKQRRQEEQKIKEERRIARLEMRSRLINLLKKHYLKIVFTILFLVSFHLLNTVFLSRKIDYNYVDSNFNPVRTVFFLDSYVLPTLEKEGYDFLGWEDTVKGGFISTIPRFKFYKFTLKPIWEQKQVKIYDFFKIDNITYLNYGKYPQTVVSDIGLISILDSITSTNANGYYEHQGDEYAKLVAIPYTAYGLDPKFNNGLLITSGQTYYFKVEPIKWQVLEDSNGAYTLLSEYLIDTKIFDESSNDYELSYIRNWLNNEFYNKAFSASEKENIITTVLDNTGSNNEIDKVYLLSDQEAMSSTYGFMPSLGSHPTRYAFSTDFTRALGAYHTSLENYGIGYWWLRSPSNDSFRSVKCVVIGSITYYSDISDSRFGARPTFRISKYY